MLYIVLQRLHGLVNTNHRGRCDKLLQHCDSADCTVYWYAVYNAELSLPQAYTRSRLGGHSSTTSPRAFTNAFTAVL